MKKLLFLIISVFVSAAAFSQNVKPTVDLFFTAEEQQRVLDGEIISRMCIAQNAWGENTDLTMTILSALRQANRSRNIIVPRIRRLFVKDTALTCSGLKSWML